MARLICAIKLISFFSCDLIYFEAGVGRDVKSSRNKQNYCYPFRAFYLKYWDLNLTATFWRSACLSRLNLVFSLRKFFQQKPVVLWHYLTARQGFNFSLWHKLTVFQRSTVWLGCFSAQVFSKPKLSLTFVCLSGDESARLRPEDAEPGRAGACVRHLFRRRPALPLQDFLRYLRSKQSFDGHDCPSTSQGHPGHLKRWTREIWIREDSFRPPVLKNLKFWCKLLSLFVLCSIY